MIDAMPLGQPNCESLRFSVNARSAGNSGIVDSRNTGGIRRDDCSSEVDYSTGMRMKNRRDLSSQGADGRNGYC
jgi:hypothetical protein